MLTPTLSSANYTVTAIPGALTITPAPLTVTALNATREQGQANPTFQAQIAGFVLGQRVEALGGTLGVMTDADSAAPAGSYALASGGLTSNNYDIRFVPAVLTVKTPPQTAAAAPARKIALMIATSAHADQRIAPLNTPAADAETVGRELNERFGAARGDGDVVRRRRAGGGRRDQRPLRHGLGGAGGGLAAG